MNRYSLCTDCRLNGLLVMNDSMRGLPPFAHFLLAINQNKNKNRTMHLFVALALSVFAFSPSETVVIFLLPKFLQGFFYIFCIFFSLSLPAHYAVYASYKNYAKNIEFQFISVFSQFHVVQQHKHMLCQF